MAQEQTTHSAQEIAQSLKDLIKVFDQIVELADILSDSKAAEFVNQLQPHLVDKNIDLVAVHQGFETSVPQIPEIKLGLNDLVDFLMSDDHESISIQYLALLRAEVVQLNNQANFMSDWLPRIATNLQDLTRAMGSSQEAKNTATSLFNLLRHATDDIKSTSKKLKELNLFRHFRTIGNNIVIIGSNGSGKSTFSRRVKKVLGNNITIIPAQKLFAYDKIDNIPVQATTLSRFLQVQSEDRLAQEWGVPRRASEDSRDLLLSLVSEYHHKAAEYYQGSRAQQIQREDSFLEKVMDVWNQTITHRSMTYADSQIWIQDSSGNKYDLPHLSDGEKAILHYVGHVLLAKPDSYVIIDEPENHLHAGVVTKLWNTLEDLRGDCTFIYLTHNLGFASSRTSATKLWARGYHHPDHWDVQRLPELDSFPENLTMELLGSRQPILFCEGSITSLDCKLYTLMFPEYTVKPVDGHPDVINHTRAFNKSREIHGNKAIGIIDGDWHLDSEIAAWQKDSIYCMEAQEVENLLCDQMLLEVAAKEFCCEDNTIPRAKAWLLNKIRSEKDALAVKHATHSINNVLRSNPLDKARTIQELKDMLNDCIQQQDIDELVSKRIALFDQILEDQDFELAIKSYNNKGIIGILGNRVVSSYGDRILRYLRNHPELLEILRQKYFPKVPRINSGDGHPCSRNEISGASDNGKK